MTEAAPAPFTVIKGKTPKAWKVLLYGTPGCGKSTLASLAPKPLFLDLEGGLDRVDCERTPRISSFEDVRRALRFAVTEGYKTVVFDTIDEIEKMLIKAIVSREGKSSFQDKAFSYGRGGNLLVEEWKEFVGILDAIHARGVNSFLIGHEQVKKFEDPTSDNYDRFILKMHEKSSAYLTAKMDAVLFARYEQTLVEKLDGRGHRATGGGRRVIHTSERPCWVAKNRFDLPEKIPMDATLFEKLI